MSWNGYEYNVLLRNEGQDSNGTLQLIDVAMQVGADDIKDARGVAIADFDNDGDLDIAINNHPGDLVERPEHASATLLRNDIGNRRNWLAVELEGTLSNRDGVGAAVKINGGGISQMRHVSAGSSSSSQNSARLYFGLDDLPQVQTMTLHWPSGKIESFENIRANQLVRITEGKGIERLTLPGQPTQTAGHSPHEL